MNSNRGAQTPFSPLPQFLFHRNARELVSSQMPADFNGSPAPPVMRYARPGERPPSRYAAGQSDGVIARFDAFAASFQPHRR